MVTTKFDPAWPDAVIMGYGTMRTTYAEESTDVEGKSLEWLMLPALSDDESLGICTMVVIGDLVCRTPREFAGVQAFAFLAVRDMPRLDDSQWAAADALLTTHAGWITHGLYDVAANTMRSMLSGGSFIEVPMLAPDHQLVLAADVLSDDSEGEHKAQM